MTNWTIRAEDHFGHARIVLAGDGQPVGVATIPMGEYYAIWRKLMGHVLKTSREEIVARLTERLYQDAIATFGLSTETASAKLIEFGWTSEKIKAYADEMATAIAQKLAESLPGGR